MVVTSTYHEISKKRQVTPTHIEKVNRSVSFLSFNCYLDRRLFMIIIYTQLYGHFLQIRRKTQKNNSREFAIINSTV